MNSRRLTIASAKTNHVLKSLAQISPAPTGGHRPLASYATLLA
ncbi:hypothetical protein ACVWXN_004770 [Bradyrhizobium sp. i1.4.4]